MIHVRVNDTEGELTGVADGGVKVGSGIVIVAAGLVIIFRNPCTGARGL